MNVTLVAVMLEPAIYMIVNASAPAILPWCCSSFIIIKSEGAIAPTNRLIMHISITAN